MTDDAKVRLRPHLSVIVHSPDEVEFRHGVWNPMSFTVSDAARAGHLASLVDALDGTASPAQLAAVQELPVEEVHGLLDRLGELDLLERRPSSALDTYLGAAAPWRVDDNLEAGARVLLVGEDALVSRLQPVLGEVLVDNPVVVVGDEDPARAVLDDPDTSWIADGLATEERLSPFESWRGAVVVAPSRVVNPLRFKVLNRASYVIESAGCTRPWTGRSSSSDQPFSPVSPAATSVSRRACSSTSGKGRVTSGTRGRSPEQR